MWVDKGLYWAWKSNENSYFRPPSDKQVVYAKVRFAETSVEQSVAIGVWDAFDTHKIYTPSLSGIEQIEMMLENGYELVSSLHIYRKPLIRDKNGLRFIE